MWQKGKASLWYKGMPLSPQFIQIIFPESEATYLIKNGVVSTYWSSSSGELLESLGNGAGLWAIGYLGT